ncbi:HNH endonuclease [Allokutzneria sp. NRRL B-24872]|uniref:HNH endonuclease n=1 Tax=Allokutzneria sp. NRRL B-24872 TaxID=1137961 RepID=UPI001FED56A9|nr:HNH endonuclease signature motif containing protein [Allokutzneria sp. NRRL B-24872]
MIITLVEVGIEDVTAPAVREALAEHDVLGLPAFCDRYGFDRTREFVITVDGRRYGTKVIAAAAHGRLPGCSSLSPAEVGDGEAVNDQLERLGFKVSEQRPPPWKREELILACSLLFKNGRKALRATDQVVKDLSALLGQLPFHAAEDRGNKFRSVNSVQHKLYDLMTRLPTYDKVETRAGHLDHVVLREFLADEAGMHAQAEAIRATYGALRAWAVFSSSGDRKYGGNSGYADVLGVQYVYDNNVSNALQVSIGDLIVVRDRSEVHGVGRVHRIDQQDGVTKTQLVCPMCRRGRFDKRKKQIPRYRCRREDCRQEFDEPVDNPVKVTQFVAFYGSTWRPLDGAVEPDELKPMFLDSAVQNAIRPLNATSLEAMLARLTVKLPPTPPNDSRGSKKQLPGGRRPAKTKARNGQSPFRKELLKRYGSRCAITGPCPVEALQAAHLKSFAEHETHDLDEGVLLRADVHLLFDSGLLAIDPTTWRVVLSPALSMYERYTDLAGVEFVKGPNPEVIRQHFDEVTTTWS